MKILFPYHDLHSIHGSLRVMLAVADICKLLGYEVKVLGDSKAATKLPGEDTPITRHYEIEDIGDYYPLKTLDPSDISKTRLYSMRAYEYYLNYDLVWTFSAMLDRIEDHVERPYEKLNDPHGIELKEHWSYQHWPVSGDYPHPRCKLFANSNYTMEAVKRRWGRPVTLLHPPLPLERYSHERGYSDRPIDLIYIGRVDPLKLGRPPIFQRLPNLKSLIVGAEFKTAFPDYQPKITWVKNATFHELKQWLSKSKVYVHWKYFFDNVPEHFGIVVAEALASGIPTIVPKAGGPWTDISDFGKYAIGVDSIEEAIDWVERLVSDEDLWYKYHFKALEGVQRFSYFVATEKIKNALDGLLYTGE